MKNQQSWIASQNLRALVQYLTERGVPAESSLGKLSGDIAHLDDPEYRFPASDYLLLMDLGAEHTKDPWFGHHYGTALRPERWGVAGYIAYHCENLGDALQAQQRYQGLVGNLGEPALETAQSLSTLHWHSSIPGVRHVAEEVIAGWQVFVRAVTGNDLQFQSVQFAHPAAGDPAELEEFFRCPVYFDRDSHAVQFASKNLGQRFRNADSLLTDTLRQRADAMLASLQSDNDPKQALQQYVLETLPDHVPELEELGAQINVSPRTLQRRLRQWGTNYKQLLDNTRREAALAYFEQGGTNVMEVTFLLGFSEQAAFHRAFKRWTGETPGQYRDARLAAD